MKSLFFTFLIVQTMLTISPQYLNAKSTALSHEPTGLYKNIIILPSFDKMNKNTKVKEKWNKYIEAKSSIDDFNFDLAIEKMRKHYAKALMKCEQCAEDLTEKEKEYSSEWTQDFKAKFPQEKIFENKEIIRKIIIGLNMKQSMGYCDENTRDAIYAELQYIFALKKFANWFLEFFDTLDEKDKKAIYSTKMAYEKAYEDLNMPPFMQKMTAENNFTNISVLIMLDKYAKAEPDFTSFFLGHPSFNKPFSVFRAINDLNGLIDSQY